jgi:AhpD family alkylhydroperoxidase
MFVPLLTSILKETPMYDMNNMKKMKKYAELAPAAWQGFLAFDKAAMADGALPANTKELIALAVAMTTQCPYCIEIHGKRAKNAGCTEAEIAADAVFVAAALRAGGAVTHGTHCLE